MCMYLCKNIWRFFFSDLDSGTPLFLGATAGMRILEEYNATIANILFENIQLEIESFELWKITSDGIRTITENEGNNCIFRDTMHKKLKKTII